MKNYKYIILALVLLFTATISYSQTIYSPYSNYGLGNMSDMRNPALKAMGKSGYAFRDHAVINFSNPASYTAFDTLSFLFEAAFDINSLTLSTNSYNERFTYPGLSQIQMGFPIWKYIKASVGLLPLSNVGYFVENKVVDEETGSKIFQFGGDGGVNSFYGGLGFQIWDISIGANVSYLFGNIDKSQALVYSDSANFLNTKLLDQISLSSVMVDLGAQYYTKIGKDLYLSLGLTYRPQQNLSATSAKVAYNYIINSYGTETLKDTILVIQGSDMPVTMPQKIGAGVMLKKLNRYKIHANFDWTEWSKYQDISTTAGSLHNCLGASLGFEYQPRAATLSSYWKWVRYRVGAYYNQGNFSINDTKINQFGMTFGVGLPIARSSSTINLSLDVGNRGTKNNNLIQETYLNFTVGFSLYDTWFYRIKYK
ncbi:hypothetical protein LJC25_03525 [Bacteroidales bacterium OttesenSCG-928-K03]|nr:hypothetical protein [Odoribacter sp. OttesenSCG-928-L07]MDL2239703.1 hypothetical protein [Bacteroidales bacterium OttesenSCG-928-L14]MDL2240806.1 hypothetical protein [Bacteroidales bacterium OttesenSCG-928-K22]MDL2242781.1 hypothetical protein [Bacteroidales bacterium OttesenSCG-928-K03]